VGMMTGQLLDLALLSFVLFKLLPRSPRLRPAL
jgi:hypothetical protein